MTGHDTFAAATLLRHEHSLRCAAQTTTGERCKTKRHIDPRGDRATQASGEVLQPWLCGNHRRFPVAFRDMDDPRYADTARRLSVRWLNDWEVTQ